MKWEYEHLILDAYNDISAPLNEYGKGGWEAWSAVLIEGMVHIYLKRQVKE